MSEPGEWVPYVAGPAGVVGLWKVVEWLVSSKVKRGETVEAKAEDERDAKLAEVLRVVQKMEGELALLSLKLSTQAVESGELKARIDGMSSNYGGRLGGVEQRLAVLDEGVRELRERRRR